MVEEDSGVPKEVVSTPIASNENQLMVLSSGQPQGVMTRARRALVTSIRLGLVYNCSDKEALQGIAANIAAQSLR